MSLINDALKKAQRQRNEEAELAAPMPGGGRRPSKRGTALSTQSIVVLATVGIALFVVCVVVSVIWINRPAPTKPLPAKSAVTKTASEAPTPAPIVVPLAGGAKTAEPVVATVTVPTAPAVGKPALAQLPAAATAAPTMSSARSAPVSDLASSSRTDESPTAPRELAPSFARAADPVPSPTAPNSGKFDERIQALVDGFRVAGIRASGTGSKVLLNEKVFKINDVVDRTNSLRLTQVANDRLTFTTPDGVTYVKNF